MKLSPFYSAFANFAAAATEAGADGLVLFNRFYQPDLDLESIEVVPRLELSQPWEMRLPVRWIAILRPQLDPDVSLAATSGAHSGADVAKGLLVGADVVMMTSALLRHGPEHVATVEAELRAWMAEHEYTSVSRAARERQRGDGRRTRPHSSVPTTWRRSIRGRRPRADLTSGPRAPRDETGCQGSSATVRRAIVWTRSVAERTPTGDSPSVETTTNRWTRCVSISRAASPMGVSIVTVRVG